MLVLGSTWQACANCRPKSSHKLFFCFATSWASPSSHNGGDWSSLNAPRAMIRVLFAAKISRYSSFNALPSSGLSRWRSAALKELSHAAWICHRFDGTNQGMTYFRGHLWLAYMFWQRDRHLKSLSSNYQLNHRQCGNSTPQKRTGTHGSAKLLRTSFHTNGEFGHPGQSVRTRFLAA